MDVVSARTCGVLFRAKNRFTGAKATRYCRRSPGHAGRHSVAPREQQLVRTLTGGAA